MYTPVLADETNIIRVTRTVRDALPEMVNMSDALFTITNVGVDAVNVKLVTFLVSKRFVLVVAFVWIMAVPDVHAVARTRT